MTKVRLDFPHIVRAVKEHLIYARNGIKHFFKNENQMWLSFLLPALILLVSYFIFGVWPFGKESVLSLDLNGQYVYYYDHMYDVIYGGESLFYSWSRNLSGEWMGIIGYYLGSPFNWIVWLLPRAWILEGLLAMMCVKVGAIGLAMSVYLSRGKRFKKLTVIIFSVCYALCAYTITQTMNPMWLDGVIALPLICLGIERFIDQGRFRLLVAAWVYAFVTCFYIGFMLAIFSAIYFYFYILITKNERAREHFFGKMFGALGLGVTAVLISCFMLIPVYESLSYGKFEFSTPNYEVVENFPIIETFDKLLPNSYDTVRMTGLPFLYCGVITVLLLPSYFFHSKIRRSERIGYGLLLLFMFLCMYIRPVDMMWHGGQMPNWLPYRYSFILSFLMVVCAATAFDRLKELSAKTIGVTCVGWLAVMIYQESMDNYVPDLNNGRDTLDNFSVIIPAMIIVVILTAMLVQLRRGLNFDLRKNMSKVLSVIILIAVCGEAMYNAVGQIHTQDRDIVYSNHDSYVDVIFPVRDKVNEIKEEDDGFYRIEKLFFRTVNDPLAIGAYGLSHSSSTLNAQPIELLSRLGFTSRSHYTRYSGATLITSSLFGVKYELTTPNNTTGDIKDAHLPITVTQNKYALPINYIADNNIQGLELTDDDPFAAQTELLNALIGKDYQYYERIYDVDLKTINLNQGSTTDGHHSFAVVTSGQTASLTYTFDMPKTGELYMYLPSIYERAVNINLNGSDKGQYFEGDNNYMRNFGEFQQGEHITLVLTLTKDNLYFREAQFAIMDKEQVQTALSELLELNSETLCYQGDSTTHIVTEVNCDADRTLFTTIPDEKGWTVFVDGRRTDYLVTVDSLIAIPLAEGYHKVEMRFLTAGYPAAVLLSIAGVIIFIGLIILWLKLHPKDRARRRAHLQTIYSGEAYLALKKRDAEDKENRKRIRLEDDPAQDSDEEPKKDIYVYDEDEDEEDEDEDEEIAVPVDTLSGSGVYETELDETFDDPDDPKEYLNKYTNTPEHPSSRPRTEPADPIQDRDSGGYERRGRSDMRDDTRDDMRDDRRYDTRDDMRDDMRYDMRDDRRYDTRDDMRDNMRDDMRYDTRYDARGDMRNNMRYDTRDDMRDYRRNDTGNGRERRNDTDY